MFIAKTCLFVAVVLIADVANGGRILRQAQQQPDNFAQFGLFVGDDQIIRRNPTFNAGAAQPQIQTTTPIPATTVGVPTTASPQYLACMERCRSTTEYNPVCGTDSINYMNQARLECAQRCGKNVQRVRLGTCLPL